MEKEGEEFCREQKDRKRCWFSFYFLYSHSSHIQSRVGSPILAVFFLVYHTGHEVNNSTHGVGCRVTHFVTLFVYICYFKSQTIIFNTCLSHDRGGVC